jgi:hypothetical protein
MFYLLVVGAGISVALQQVLNANLRMELGSPWWAGFVSYLVGTIFMLAIATMSDQPWLSTATIARTSWISWAGGFRCDLHRDRNFHGASPRRGDSVRPDCRGPDDGLTGFRSIWLVRCSPAYGKSGPARGRSLSRSRRDPGPFLIDDVLRLVLGHLTDPHLLRRP